MKYSDVKEKLISLFDREILKTYPKEWGFYGEDGFEITRVGYATNLSRETANAAKEQGISLLLTHHDAWDFVFGLKEPCHEILREAGIAHAFFHTPLDDADFGTSASLAEELGLTGVERAVPYEGLYAGRIGTLQIEMSHEEFKKRLEEVLGEPVRSIMANERPVKKVCVVTGAGHVTTEMKSAVDAGCDIYVTGEYGLYSGQYAELTGMSLLVGSHTRTEIFGVKSLAGLLCDDTDMEMTEIPEKNY